MIIYQITNIVTNDFYIGQTVQKINNRFSNHKSYARNGGKTHLCNAFRKYGETNFIIEKLESVNDKLSLDEKEQFWIKILKPRYNETLGGGGASGWKHSEESKRKISQSHKGKIPWNKGVKLTEETRKKMSESGKNRVFSEKHRENLSKSKTGKNHHNFNKNLTSEHKLNISVGVKKYHLMTKNII